MYWGTRSGPFTGPRGHVWRPLSPRTATFNPAHSGLPFGVTFFKMRRPKGMSRRLSWRLSQVPVLAFASPAGGCLVVSLLTAVGPPGHAPDMQQVRAGTGELSPGSLSLPGLLPSTSMDPGGWQPLPRRWLFQDPRCPHLTVAIRSTDLSRTIPDAWTQGHHCDLGGGTNIRMSCACVSA